jgi:hypothetical protein
VPAACRSEPRRDVRAAHAGARAALVVAPAALLLRVCGRGRRRDRRAPLGRPERAGRTDGRGAVDHRLRRAALDQPRVDPGRRDPLDARMSGPEVLDRVESIETATMVRPEQGAATARMVELRGVQPGFPLYGQLLLQGRRPVLARSAAGTRRARQTRAARGARHEVGGRIVIGGQPFTIRGVITQEPGRRAGAFSFGSRVLVDYDDLRNLGLLTFGSRASYQILLRVREDAVERLAREIRRDFQKQFVQARSYRSTEDDIGEDLLRAENYLSLVGFVMVVLGGIGVWSVTRVFVTQKIRSVAILKCVGATSGQVLATYVAQVLCLGLGGSLLGVGIAAVAIAAIPESAAAAFDNVSYGLTGSAVLQGVGVGLLVSLLFSLVPLLEVRRVKPLLLLARRRTPHLAHPIPWLRASAVGLHPGRRAPRRPPAGGRRGAGDRGARGHRGVAGGVLAGRPRRVRRLRGRRAGRCTGRGRSSSVPCGRSPRRRTFPCATPSAACRGPGTRPGSSSWPSGSAVSSCSACGPCRAICSNSSRCSCSAAARHVPRRRAAGSGRGRPRLHRGAGPSIRGSSRCSAPA